MLNLLRKKPLISYFILAYLFTWGIVSPLVAYAQGWSSWNAPGWLHYLAPYGPLLSALIMTAATTGRDGLKDFFGRLFRWQVNPWVAAAAILSPGLLFLIAALIEMLGGASWPDMGTVQFELVPVMSFGVGYLFIVLTYGIGEEAGWRGFALPHLQSKHTAMVSSMYLSFGWAAWHLPMFFYKENFIEMGLFGAFGWLVSLMFGTVFFTWLYNASGGSVLMCALWHGAFDLFTASTLGSGLAPMLMSIVLMAAVVAIVWVYGRENLAHLEKQRVID